jgi:hypothetical protein
MPDRTLEETHLAVVELHIAEVEARIERLREHMAQLQAEEKKVDREAEVLVLLFDILDLVRKHQAMLLQRLQQHD